MNSKALSILRVIVISIFIISIALTAYYDKFLRSTNYTLVLLSILNIIIMFFIEVYYNKALINEKKEIVYGKKMKINIYSIGLLVFSFNCLFWVIIDCYRKESIGIWLILFAFSLVFSILRMECYPLRINKKKITKDELLSIEIKKITKMEIIDEKIVINGAGKNLMIDYKKLGIDNPIIITNEIERLKLEV